MHFLVKNLFAMADFLTTTHLVEGQGGFAVFDAVVDAFHHEVHLRPVGQQVCIGAFIPEMDTDDFVYFCMYDSVNMARAHYIHININIPRINSDGL